MDRPMGLFGSSGGRSLGRDLAAQPCDGLLEELPVGRCQFGQLGRRRAGLLFNLLEHVGQHLRRAQIGAGRFDSQPGDDQERRQVLAARVALPEAPARGRLALADP